MIGIDTNIVLRYVLNDDAVQSPRARAFIDTECSAEKPAMINATVLLKLFNFLTQKRGAKKPDIAILMNGLLGNAHVAFEPRDVIISAFEAYLAGKAGLSDYLIHFENLRLGASSTATFDHEASRSPFMTRLN